MKNSYFAIGLFVTNIVTIGVALKEHKKAKKKQEVLDEVRKELLSIIDDFEKEKKDNVDVAITIKNGIVRRNFYD